jgi:putative ABC transport system permease protein
MPDFTREVRARLSSLHLAPTREQDIIDELSQHLEERWRELVAKGASADEATRQTLALFRDGDLLARYIATLKQANPPAPITPGASTGRAWPDLRHHVRYAARILWRQPGFAAIALLTLALGIGATTAIFSVVYNVLLKPLPFYEPERLVSIFHVSPAMERDFQGNANHFTYRDHGRVFEDFGLWGSGNVSVIRNGTPEQIAALRVTDGTLTLLGVRAQSGRLIGKDDDAANAPLKAMLTHGYWRRTFGGERNVIGQSLVIDGRPHEIIGVLPASFKLLAMDPDVVVPYRMNRANIRSGPLGFNGLARLKPGVTIEQANADIARMLPLVTREFPLMPGLTQEMLDGFGIKPNVRPLAESVTGQIGRPLWILLGAVGVVLLMAWANVANLLLVRAEGRQRELAVRTALGASSRRLAGELLSESLVLGLAGGALGVVVAQAALGLLRQMAPAALPRVNDIGIDGVVLAVTLLTSIATSLVFGLIPVFRFRKINVDALKDAGRSGTDAPGRHRTRNVLVVAQVALGLVLLILSGLMGRTFIAMKQVPAGFVEPASVQTFVVSLPAALIREQPQVSLTYQQIEEAVRRVPGVKSVGLTGAVTLKGETGKAPVFIGGGPLTGAPPTRSAKSTGAGYFETVGNPVVAGRTITWTDILETRPVALITENLAREYWDDPAKAVGTKIRMFPNEPGDEIVGVVGNERADGLNRPAPAIVYYPMAGSDFVNRTMTYVVRSERAGTAAFVRELQQAVWSVRPNVPLASMRTLEDIQSSSMSQTSFAMAMLAISAGVALLLGVIGLYGVIRYIVAQRTREIGIRMALGAQVGDVRLLFLRHGLALTAVGIAIGLGASILLTRVMSSLLFGVARTDPFTYIAAALGLAAVAALATYLPARRASATDPIAALRETM